MKFDSKRNHVYLENSYVIKKFTSSKNFENELYIHSLIENKLNVAKIISKADLEIVYDYVEGSLYVDLVDNLTYQEASSLIKWIYDFRSITSLEHPDLNLRNFIYNETRGCVGIDFETINQSISIENDFAKLLAFTSTYSPSFSLEKKRSVILMLKILKKYNLSFDLLESLYLEEIKNIILRRNNIDFTYETAKTFIKEALDEKENITNM